MKTCEEMTASLLARREKYLAEQRTRRKRLIRLSSSAACCALLVGLALLAPRTRSDPPAPTPAGSDAPPESPTSGIPTGDSGPADPGLPVSDPAGAGDNGLPLFRWRDGLSLRGSLYWALENDPEDTFRIAASYRPVLASPGVAGIAPASFVYGGKTLSEWAAAEEEGWLLKAKMEELLKLGDALALGDALWQSGTPDGEKWDRRFYEDKVAFYGEELLGRYLADGVFLRDDLERDLAALREHPASESYAAAYNAYLDAVLPHAAQQLADAGISCARAGYRLVFTAAADELEHLPLDDLQSWTFALADEALSPADGSVSPADDSVG